MWIERPAGSPWANPCGAVVLSPEARARYQHLFDVWQRAWHADHPGLQDDPRWYARANPRSAAGYPPGFLKRDLDAVVLVTPSSPDTDGYFWANERVYLGVDSYETLAEVVAGLPSPVEMLILSGECLQVAGPACGVCWHVGPVGFDATMPAEVAALLREKIVPAGLFVLGSCHSGNDPALVQGMADVIGRPVAAAVGVCRGVRAELLFGDGVHWTMGGFAEGGAFTLREPADRLNAGGS